MQKVAAYLLEQPDLLTPAARAEEAERLYSVLSNWLRQKGATDESPLLSDGAYSAVDGSKARYRTQRAIDGERQWLMVELREESADGRVFDASISVTTGRSTVFVYAVLEVGTVASQVNRIEVDPKCPRVIRNLIEAPRAWYHGATRLKSLSSVCGFEGGEQLALEITSPERTLPLVAVSTVNGHSVLPGLPERLAYDLAGIANVYAVDDSASWALTDELRKPLSCYGGAVRVYWPGLSLSDDPYRHPLWTWNRLASLEDDPRRALERFRHALRGLVMRASAASVVRPREIEEIRGAAARAEYAALKSKASSLEDFRELADSYAGDNDTLREKLNSFELENDRLRTTIAQIEAERDALRFHLQKAGADSSVSPADGIAPEIPDAAEVDEAPPNSGDVRFYKKKYSAPTHDILVRVADCDHNSWQNAAKADKAKKGIAKLEGLGQTWQVVQHCAKCTGGGMWRVQW